MEPIAMHLPPILLAAARDDSGGHAGTLVMIFAIAGVAIAGAVLTALMTRYKRCPSHRLMVITGRLPGGMRCRIIQSGAAFVWPLLQQVDYLDLEPRESRVALGPTRLKDNVDLEPVATVTLAISTDQERMQAAANRLLGMEKLAIDALADDLVRGVLTFELAGIASTELDADRQGVIARLQDATTAKLAEVGLDIIAFEFA